MSVIGSWKRIATISRKNFLSRSLFGASKLILTLHILRNPYFIARTIGRMQSTDEIKRPNILVFIGVEHNQEKFENIQENLLYCLNNNRYVVYNLTPAQVLRDPWQDQCELLVVSCDSCENQISKCFFDYLFNGGKLLNFCSGIEISKSKFKRTEQFEECLTNINYKDVAGAVIYRGNYLYETKGNVHNLCYQVDTERPVITKFLCNKGTIIQSELHLELDPVMSNLTESQFSKLKQYNENRLYILKDILSSEFCLECSAAKMPELTGGFIFSEDKRFSKKLSKIISSNSYARKNITLQLIDNGNGPVSEANPHLLPIHLENFDVTKVPFNKNTYFSQLKTKDLGQSVLFVEVVTTTMTISELLPEINGLVVIAHHQTQGRGRGNNRWISPKGCAMFTLHLSLSLFSYLGQRLSILQHLASLSIIEAVRKYPGYEGINLNLKWPNDIYFGRQNKIGGVIVSSSIQGHLAHVYIGCGVNVDNQQPILCINDVITLYNSLNKTSLPLLSMEEIIARSLTELEIMISEFDETSLKSVMERYYSYWLHGNQKVTVSVGNRAGTVIGLDEFGFLLVQTQTGEKIVLQPDGNRFDIIKNLIIAREQVK